MPTTALTLGETATRHHPETNRRYVAPMATAASVTAALQTERPGLTPAKTQLLLFFCQGHHLADLDTPLYVEPTYAAGNGVTVENAEPGDLLDEGGLNTVGYVLSRYGSLSPADLRTLIQASAPWQMACRNSSEPRIEWAWLRDWFRRAEERNDSDDDRPTADLIAAFKAYRQGQAAT